MPRRVLLSAFIVSTAMCTLSSSAWAQLAAPPPMRSSVDANGVDLFTGVLNVRGPSMSLGRGSAQGLQYYQLNTGSGWGDNIVGMLNVGGSLATVTLGGKSDTFTLSGSTYTSTEGNGATLSFNSSTNIYTYTAADGTVAHINYSYAGSAPFNASNGRVTDITRPSGQKLNYSYHNVYYCSASKPGGGGQLCTSHKYAYRLTSVQSSYGYAIYYSYLADDGVLPEDGSVPTNEEFQQWATVTSIGMRNLANASSATPSQSAFPTYVSGSSYYNITDPMGRTTAYRQNTTTGGIAGITLPGSSSEDVTIAYSGSRVSSVTNAAGTTTYGAPSDVSGVRTVTVTDPASNVTTYTFDIASKRMTSVTDPLSHTTSYSYDANGRLTQVAQSYGNYVHLTYDARGNVTERRQVAKSGSGLADIVETASYDATCLNAVTCNQPNSTTNAIGKTTSFTYDPTTGNVLTVTLPSATSGGTQPQTRYSYTSYQAYYDPAGGTSYVASGQPVSLLTGVSQCQTGSSCIGTSDEVRTTTSYGPQTTGTGNNLLPVSVTQAAGDGSVTRTTGLFYDSVGNLTSVDGPLAGAADTTTYRYDADREQVGIIAPDPDGAGPLVRKAQRNSYTSHGVLAETEIGTVNGTSDTDWAAFSSQQQVTTTLDGADRKIKDVLTAGGSTFQVVQYGYDTAGHLQCTALRLNSATWGSLPSSACTPATAGSDGPDRINFTHYNADDSIDYLQSGYGVLPRTIATYGYTPYGQLAYLADANGKRTAYSYDGFNRAVKTCYVAATSGDCSSTADYDQFLYDAYGRLTSHNLRGYPSASTKHIDFTYDDLGRLTLKQVGDGTISDTYYGYDLLGRMLYARFGSASGAGITNAYDALGQLTSTANNLSGTSYVLSYQYDAAGNRMRVTHPDGVYFASTYDSLSRLSNASWWTSGGGTTLFLTINYDNLGRRTSINRASSYTNYGYDSASRLNSQSQTFAGGTGNLSQTLGYNAASQINSQTRSSDQAFTGYANVNRAYTTNGLNQYTAAGSASFTYDARGNLTSDGTNSYGYDAENHMVSKNGTAATLSYDPLGRLWSMATASGTTRFLYDGADLVAEYNGSGAMTKRYMFADTDEAILEDTGSALNCAGTKFNHTDERSSVIAQADCWGNRSTVETYDEFGIPGSGNTSRFQYTGQAYLSEIGMSYYKARMYSPTLGRFMQTDPIGYDDGPNWYNYVHADPVNNADPTGKMMTTCTGSIQTYPGTYDCSGVPFLQINGMDTQAAAMQASAEATYQLDRIADAINQSPGAGNVPLYVFDKLSDSDKALVKAIMSDQDVVQKMHDAWADTINPVSTGYGLEHSFNIYEKGEDFIGGSIFIGTPSTTNRRQNYELMFPLGTLVADYHDHPGNYVNAGFTDLGDIKRNLNLGIIGFIQSNYGFIYGRGGHRVQ